MMKSEYTLLPVTDPSCYMSAPTTCLCWWLS